jgi:hypothetical protein
MLHGQRLRKRCSAVLAEAGTTWQSDSRYALKCSNTPYCCFHRTNCYLPLAMQDFTKILLVAIFYSPFYPLIYFLSATILFIQYWVDKFLLLVSFYHVSSPMHLLVPYQPLQHPQNHRGAGRKHLSLAQKRRGSVEFISPLLLSSWEQYLQLSPMLNLHLLSCVVVTKIVIVSATSPIHNHSPTLSF